jgi:O-antigen ligase
LSSRPLPLLPSSPAPIATAALVAAIVVGTLLARDPKLGLGLMIAMAYVPLVMLNLPLGIVLWVVLTFIQGLSVVSVAPNVTAILIGLAWLGTVRSRRDWAAEVYQRHRKLLMTGLLFVVWAMLSALWARDPDLVWAGEFWQLPVALAIFAVLIGSFPSRRWVVWLAAAFVAGATLSVLIGLVSDGLNPSGDALASAAEAEGRLQGANGDPNYLAAGCVPALALAAALIGITRNAMVKWGLTAVMAVLVAGLAASESRGGFLAAIVAVAVAVVVNKRHRAKVIAVIAVVASLTAMYFAAYPNTFERVTQVDGGGNGRTDLWFFATEMTKDHPLAGTGLNNYPLVAKDYVHEPGARDFSFLITETPHVAHSVYLQLLAELGVIGLALFLVFVAGCLRAALVAARRFDDLGEFPMAGLARAAFVAMTGMLAASVFISNLTDRRMWILFAFGPILLALASRPREASEG